MSITSELFPIRPRLQQQVFRIVASLDDETLALAEELQSRNVSNHSPEVALQNGYLRSIGRMGVLNHQAYETGVLVGGTLARTWELQHPGIVLHSDVNTIPGHTHREMQAIARTSRFALQQFFQTERDMLLVTRRTIELPLRKQGVLFEAGRTPEQSHPFLLAGMSDDLAVHAITHGTPLDELELRPLYDHAEQ